MRSGYKRFGCHDSVAFIHIYINKFYAPQNGASVLRCCGASFHLYTRIVIEIVDWFVVDRKCCINVVIIMIVSFICEKRQVKGWSSEHYMRILLAFLIMK